MTAFGHVKTPRSSAFSSFTTPEKFAGASLTGKSLMQGVESWLHKSQWQTPTEFTGPTVFPRVVEQNPMNKICVPKYNL